MPRGRTKRPNNSRARGVTTRWSTSSGNGVTTRSGVTTSRTRGGMARQTTRSIKQSDDHEDDVYEDYDYEDHIDVDQDKDVQESMKLVIEVLLLKFVIKIHLLKSVIKIHLKLQM